MSFNIIYNLTDVKSASGNPTAIDTTATVTLETMYGYKLPDTVTVTGATGSWDKTTGTLSLSNPTADVTITAAGVQIHYITLDNLKKFKSELFIKIPIGTMYGANDTAYGLGSVAGYSGEDRHSIAIGYNSSAIHSYSISIGDGCTSINTNAIAIGNGAYASGDYAIAIGGSGSVASGTRSVAIGSGAHAQASYAVAIGAGSYSKIQKVVSLYGNLGANGSIHKTLLVRDPSNIFFSNEDATNTTNAYTSLSDFASGCTLQSLLDAKQATLVSGTNVKTVNGYSIVGSGNVNVSKCVSLYAGSCGYSVTLNTNYNVHDDFDILIVFCQYNSADSQQSHCIIDTAWCDNMNNSYNYNIHENVVKLQYNPQTHVLWNDNNNCMIYKVLGLKFYNN